jgi:hypothetical protein
MSIQIGSCFGMPISKPAISSKYGTTDSLCKAVTTVHRLNTGAFQGRRNGGGGTAARGQNVQFRYGTTEKNFSLFVPPSPTFPGKNF